MDYKYSEQASSIIELFFMPFFQTFQMDITMEFSKKEKENFKEDFALIEEIKGKFEPFAEEINRYYLFGYGFSLLHVIYYYAGEMGYSCQNVEEVHDYALGLSEKDIQKCIAYLIVDEEEDKEKDFWVLLEESSLKPEMKWYYSQFYREPLTSIKRLVTLSQELISIYQPYFKRGLKERRAYASKFDLDKFADSLPELTKNGLLSLDNSFLSVFILSSWFIRLSMIKLHQNESQEIGFIITCHIERFLHTEDNLDEEDFSLALKLLSDTTRYQVLQEVLQPNTKSKDIAKRLNITAAAVSFHTQKLVNAQILQFNTEDGGGKYSLNKKLLNTVLEKMADDFHL
ncbi:ArsR/SmtB family transcription factor [Streptococcus hongkongensis]|nr:transcriptional regulator [Streptococcus uberis]